MRQNSALRLHNPAAVLIPHPVLLLHDFGARRGQPEPEEARSPIHH